MSKLFVTTVLGLSLAASAAFAQTSDSMSHSAMSGDSMSHSTMSSPAPKTSDSMKHDSMSGSAMTDGTMGKATSGGDSMTHAASNNGM